MYIFKLCNPLECDDNGELKEYSLTNLYKESRKEYQWDKFRVKIPYTYTPTLDKLFNEAIKEIDSDYEISSFAKYCNGKFIEELVPILTVVAKKLGNEFPDFQNINECTNGNCAFIIRTMIKMSKAVPNGGVWVLD